MTLEEAKERALANAIEDVKQALEESMWVVEDVTIREGALLYFGKPFVYINRPAEEEEEEWANQLRVLDDITCRLMNYDEYKSGRTNDLVMRVEGYSDDVEETLGSIWEFIIESNVVQLGEDFDGPEVEWRIN